MHTLPVEIIDESNFQSWIKEGKQLVYCWTFSCEPCKKVGPLLEKIEPDFPLIKFGKLNTMEVNKLAEKFGVRAVPQILAFDEAELKGRIIHQSEIPLREQIKRFQETGEILGFDFPKIPGLPNLFGLD